MIRDDNRDNHKINVVLNISSISKALSSLINMAEDFTK